MLADGRGESMTKKEHARFDKERGKLEKNLSGIKTLKSPPDAIFVIDTRKEAIAVAEARKLKLTVIGVVDTNCDPDEVDVLIPGNDDALRAIRLFASRMAEAVLSGRGMKESADAERDAAQTDSDDARRQAPRAPRRPREAAPATA